MPKFSKWIKTLLFLMLFFSLPAWMYGQKLLPSAPNEELLYDVQIEMCRGGVTGVCLMQSDSLNFHANIINEFGVGMMSFTYYSDADKVRLHSVFTKMDKWYIRRTLRRDLRHLIHVLNRGETTYVNKKRGITYIFTPIDTNDAAQ